MGNAPQPRIIPPPSVMDLRRWDIRSICTDQLDRTMLSLTPEAAHAFLTQWGEGLREVLAEQYHGEF